MKHRKIGLIILIAAVLVAALLVPLSCPGQGPPATETEPGTVTTAHATTSRPPPSSSPTSPPTTTATTTKPSEPGEPTDDPDDPGAPTLADLFAKVAPSVVSVHVTIPASSLYSKREEFFSGLIVDESGLVITSYSLLERALDFRGNLLEDASIHLYVRDFEDSFEASLVGYRSTVDLALLKVSDPGDAVFPAQRLARDPGLAVGTAVYMIGYPPVLVREGGLATGHVTSHYRTSFEEDGSPVGLIETSMPTLPVYAGSPLIDGEGEVVAIASGYLRRIYAQNAGYAVPSPIVADVINRIMTEPDARPQGRAALGITVLSDEDGKRLAQLFHYPTGLYINLVKAESAAYTAGLNPGDILISLNGQSMETVVDLIAFLNGQVVGALVEIMVYRPGEEKTMIKTCYLLEETP